jgi:UPF0755 protein
MADGERSGREREAARLERERRRAQRRGEPIVGETADGDAAEQADGGGPEPADGGGPEPAAGGSADLTDGGAADLPELDGHRPTSETPELDEPTDRPTGEELEAPLGMRRATHLDRLRAQARRGERAPVRPRRGRTAPRRKRTLATNRRPWAGRALSVVAIAVALLAIWFLVELFQPFHGSGQGRITVTIAPHSSASQIGDQLERDGVISSSFFFNLRTILAGDHGSLQAGTYVFRRDMGYGDVLRILTTPPLAAKVTSVTIVPGDSRAQIDALLRSQGVDGSYRADTRHSPLLDPSAYGAPRSTPTLEGFLFPDTYQLRSPISITALVSDQLKQFKKVFGTVNLGYARSRHLTPYEVLIIASIIEKEAGTAHDRPLVAAVIYNRLRDHIPLGMDSTTRYEFNDYNKPLTQSQLDSPSPYNTRLHSGLPPTPISNPGLAAVEAAAHPARNNYLYFVVKVCGNGEQSFTASYDQFQTWVAHYQAARARNGGRSPTHC